MDGLDLARVRSADGTSITVASAGDPAGIPVVALHGFALGHQVFARQLAQAAVRGRYVLAPDLRGHGLSDPAPAQPDPERWVEDLDAVLDHIGRPAVVVAWSYAGLILGEYLVRRGTSRLLGIVLVAAAFAVPPAVTDPDDEFVRLLPGLLSDDATERTAADQAFVQLLTHPRREDEETVDLSGLPTQVDPALRRAMMSRLVDYTATYANADVPVHIVQGADDRLLAPVLSAHLQQQVPGSTLSVVADCGHAPFLEHPDRFDDELSALLLRIQP